MDQGRNDLGDHVNLVIMHGHLSHALPLVQFSGAAAPERRLAHPLWIQGRRSGG
jgi:hypothetical protein